MHCDILWLSTANSYILLNTLFPPHFKDLLTVSVVLQLLSHVQLFVISWTASGQASLSFITWSLLKLMSTESVMLSTHLILCCPFSPLAFNLFFQWVVSSHYVAKVFGALASASVLPMNIQNWFLLGLTGLISLLSRGFSRVFSSTTVWKKNYLCWTFINF